MKNFGWAFWEAFVTGNFALHAYIAFAESNHTTGWAWIWILVLWWRTNFNEWQGDILQAIAEQKR